MNLPAKQKNFVQLQGLKSIISLTYGSRSTFHHNKIKAGISSGFGQSRRITMFKSSRTPSRTYLDFNDAFSAENISRLVDKLKDMKSPKSLLASCTEEAAVFVPFCTVNSTPSVLFTLRSNQLNNHRGEVSFPGGKKDTEDKSVRETAVREMEEELGLDRSCVEVWAEMPAIPDRTGKTAISPILGFIGEIDVHSLNLNPNEVSSVFLLSLHHICDARNYGYTKFKSQNVMPVFFNGPHRVWGLTAIILENVLLTLVPDRYPRQVAVLHNGCEQP